MWGGGGLENASHEKFLAPHDTLEKGWIPYHVASVLLQSVTGKTGRSRGLPRKAWASWMKFWIMMEKSLGELDEILDYDGVECGF
jgi:hypothetical protein